MKKTIFSLVLFFTCLNVYAQTYTMKLAGPTINDSIVEWQNFFKREIESKTNQIKVEVYTGSQLGSIQAAINGVLSGSIEVTFAASGFYVPIEPRYAVHDSVGVFDNIKHGQKVLDDTEIQNLFKNYFTSKSAAAFASWTYSPNSLVVCKSFNSLVDLKGLKVRMAPTPMQTEVWKRFGVNPIPMSPGEVPAALQNGIIDGSISPPPIYSAHKYNEIRNCKTAMHTPGWVNTASAIINKNFLEKLPVDLRQLVLTTAKNATAYASAWGDRDLDRIIKEWQNAGAKIFYLNDSDRKLFLSEAEKIQAQLIGQSSLLQSDYDIYKRISQKYRN